MFQKKNAIKNFDFLLLFIIILLTGFGLIGIALATRSPMEGTEGAIAEAIGSFNLQQVKLQIIWFATGLVLMIIVVSVDYHKINDLAPYAYLAVIGLLVIVKFFGTTGGGAQRWIAIGSFRMQPSEFTKITVILILARIMAREDEEEEEVINDFKTIGKLIIALALPLALIIIQPDMGTAMVLAVIFAGMVFVAGIKYKYLFIALAAAVAAVPVVWYTILDDFQKKRIQVFLNPGMDPLGDGYHVLQSIISIGSGQLTGQIGRAGLLGDNLLSQLDFLPAKDTDFVFSVITEALGFIGGITIIVLYYLLIMRTLRVARRSRDKLGSYICVGVASMVLFHVFENIGMSMGIMPITGIPLPFISYGGSSMWTNMISFGLVLNVGMRRQKINF
ncbi:MAG: rod shape-determining protein RodA [Clostridiales bacterium]|nr:rod shape-determining protein RodA [Clostridiales bacterium]